MQQQKPKLNYMRTFMIGFGFFASSIAWTMYNTYVPLMLENNYVVQLVAKFGFGAGLLTTITGAFMTMDNIFGVVFQPLFGALSDKTRTKMGRRMPYITIGLPISAVLFALIPLVDSLAPFMFILILFNFVMSTWRAPVVALMPDLTPSTLRSQANGIINLMGGLGSLAAFILGGFLFNIWAPSPFLFAALIMILALVLLRIFVKEPTGEEAITKAEEGEETISIADLPPAEKKARQKSLLFLLFAIFFWFNGYNAIETLFSLYATKVLMVSEGSAALLLAFFSLSFIAASIPAGLLSNKIGRKRTILIGLAGVTILFPMLIFVKSLLLVRILLLVGGTFWACVNINSLPMVLQLCSHKDIGKYTGYYYVFSFSASITAPILAGLLRDYVKDYTSVFIYAGVAYVIAFLLIMMVKHGEVTKAQTVNEIMDQLET